MQHHPAVYSVRASVLTFPSSSGSFGRITFYFIGYTWMIFSQIRKIMKFITFTLMATFAITSLFRYVFKLSTNKKVFLTKILLSSYLVNARQEHAWFTIKGLRNGYDVKKGYISFTPFYAPYIGPVKIAKRSKFFLRYFHLKSSPSNLTTKNF